MGRVRRNRHRLGPNGSIESDPAVHIRADDVRPHAGSLPIESYRYSGRIGEPSFGESDPHSQMGRPSVRDLAQCIDWSHDGRPFDMRPRCSALCALRRLRRPKHRVRVVRCMCSYRRPSRKRARVSFEIACVIPFAVSLVLLHLERAGRPSSRRPPEGADGENAVWLRRRKSGPAHGNRRSK